MRSLHRIVAGVALHPKRGELASGTANAVQQATWLAGRLGAELVLLHSLWNGQTDEDPPAEPTADARAALDELLQTARAEGVRARLVLSRERPWLALIHASLAGDGDLVVVGKRDVEATEGRRLGSTAVKLLRKCPAPVWVVKPEHDLGCKLVLAASDLSPVGDEAVELAAYVAGQHGAALHVVHAYRIPARLQAEAADLSEEEWGERVDALKAAAQAHVDHVITESGYDGESTVHLQKGEPFQAIREAVAHLHPDLLVMGTLSEGGVPGLLVGDTAERLLDRVDCSIVGVKPANFVCPVELPAGLRRDG